MYSPELRVWSNEIAADNVARAEIRPDFSVTHQRDAALSLLGALVQVEVKLPQKLDAGVQQLACYLRRRVYKLCCERHARSERVARRFGGRTPEHALELRLPDRGTHPQRVRIRDVQRAHGRIAMETAGDPRPREDKRRERHDAHGDSSAAAHPQDHLISTISGSAHSFLKYGSVGA